MWLRFVNSNEWGGSGCCILWCSHSPILQFHASIRHCVPYICQPNPMAVGVRVAYASVARAQCSLFIYYYFWYFFFSLSPSFASMMVVGVAQPKSLHSESLLYKICSKRVATCLFELECLKIVYSYGNENPWIWIESRVKEEKTRHQMIWSFCAMHTM